MPSCVVKWCKNNTTLHKKCQGITFHRFPSGNEPWNDDWVTIIRKCRGQEDWIPTKSSVVCSTHFDQNDLLTSSKGRRRVVTFAVPQLLLFEPPKQKEQPRVEPETKSTSQAVHCDRDQEQQSLLGSDALLFEPPIKEEQPDDEPETTSSAQAVYYDHDQEQLSSLESDAEFFEPPIKEEQPDVEPDTSSLQAVYGVLDQVQQSSLRLDPQFFEPPIKEEQPDVEPETTSSLQAVFGGLGSEQAPPSPTMPRTASEQPTGSCSPLSSAQVPLHPTIRLPCDSPRTLRLKKKYK